MKKTCDTCCFGQLSAIKRCPIMKEPTRPVCFGWCKTYDEWKKRLGECAEYERRMTK